MLRREGRSGRRGARDVVDVRLLRRHLLQCSAARASPVGPRTRHQTDGQHPTDAGQFGPVSRTGVVHRKGGTTPSTPSPYFKISKKQNIEFHSFRNWIGIISCGRS